MRRVKQIAAGLVVASLGAALIPGQVLAEEGSNTIYINEVNSQPDDWIEFINTGDEAVDISGFEIRDNSNDHRWKFSEGTTIAAGQIIVVDTDTVGLMYDDNADQYVEGKYDIGLGGGDSVRLYDKDGNLLDQYSWTEHASYKGDAAKASYGRYPDGTGSFVLMPESKGTGNIQFVSQVVINEVQSNDPNKGPDWIELANPTGEVIDISGIVIKDNDDTHAYVIPEGTTIPANGFIVFTDDQFGFGLGKGDSVRLYENGQLIGSTTWTDHTNPTWGLYPDAGGSEYRNTKEPTPGETNVYDVSEEIIDAVEWPGNSEIKAFDDNSTFLEDSSGLDFYKGQLYAVDNGTAKFWILDVAEDGSLSFARGFENGKTIVFQKDADNVSAAGPDAEGITVDGAGFVYIASERDNSAKGVNYNSVLKVDPKAEGTRLVALQEWNLTASLPQVSANMGIEAVEWVSNADVAGKLVDQNTGKAFNAANYPKAVADGVFFVALEDNGHVYAYVLNSDGTSVQIADIDSKLGGAMALDYDTYEDVLWVVADNGFENRAARLTFTGEAEPVIAHVSAPAGLDVSGNNEGFAIAEAKFTKDGQRPVYRFEDGVTSGALKIGSLACDYQGTSDNDNPGTSNNVNPGTADNNNGTDISTVVDNKTDRDDNKTVGTQSPKTGDISNPYSWLVVLLAGGIAGGIVISEKRKEANKRKINN